MKQYEWWRSVQKFIYAYEFSVFIFNSYIIKRGVKKNSWKLDISFFITHFHIVFDNFTKLYKISFN